MRKIIVQEMLSVDGFFARPNGEIDWHVVDAEFNDYASSVLDSVDALVFGRVTYDLMAGYWPSPDALKDDPIIAAKMNALPKIVFSKTRETLDWNVSQILHEIDPKAIQGLKEQPGKDLIIFGSGTIVSALTQLGLVDEFRLFVAPVILGKGKTLFPTVDPSQKLQLVWTKSFGSGNILNCYHPLTGTSNA